MSASSPKSVCTHRAGLGVFSDTSQLYSKLRVRDPEGEERV